MNIAVQYDNWMNKCSFLEGWLAKHMNLRILDELTKQLNKSKRIFEFVYRRFYKGWHFGTSKTLYLCHEPITCHYWGLHIVDLESSQ